MDKSIAHKGDMNHIGAHHYPDGLVPWNDPRPPDVSNARTTVGRMRGCWYCGSMHPKDLAAALKAGATISFADWKYGWPHKAYIDKIPNPFEGMMESRSSCSHPSAEDIAAGKYIPVDGEFVVVNQTTGETKRKTEYIGKPVPSGPYEHGKFYTVHLQDATPEEKETIEAHLGMSFEFANGQVKWTGVKK